MLGRHTTGGWGGVRARRTAFERDKLAFIAQACGALFSYIGVWLLPAHGDGEAKFKTSRLESCLNPSQHDGFDCVVAGKLTKNYPGLTSIT